MVDMKLTIKDSGNSTTDGKYDLIRPWILKDLRDHRKRLREIVREMMPTWKAIMRKRGIEIEKELEDMEIPF